MGPPLHRKPSHTKLALESALNILHYLRSLKTLKWNYENVQRVDLADLIENLIGAGRLRTLERYELKLNQMYDSNSGDHVRLESYCRRKEQLLDSLKKWPEDSKCQISVYWKTPALFGWAGGKCSHREHGDSDCYGVIQSFVRFVQDEGLPIHFQIPEPPPSPS
jgi:hypothetical protein